MEKVNCNLCGSAKFEVRYQIQDFLLDRPDVVTTLVQCLDCGLIYQETRPTLDEMGQHYPPEYDSYNPKSGDGQTPWLLQKAVDYGIQKRVRFVTRQTTGGRLLDIGCATGLFLDGFARHPEWTVQGVEINSTAAQEARERYGLEIFTGTLEAANYPAGHFNAVTMWDVLEHLHDPGGSLREIHRILAPEGILVFRVPNHDSWDQRLFKKLWAGLDSPRHLYVYDPKTIRRLLKQSGFNVLTISGKIGSYPTFVLSVRFWLVSIRAKPETRDWILKTLYHPIARLISAPFFYLASYGLRSPLMVVTAAKGPQSLA
jgi:SAM-dependent methyltransferase